MLPRHTRTGPVDFLGHPVTALAVLSERKTPHVWWRYRCYSGESFNRYIIIKAQALTKLSTSVSLIGPGLKV